jgi:hypothetical protein
MTSHSQRAYRTRRPWALHRSHPFSHVNMLATHGEEVP